MQVQYPLVKPSFEPAALDVLTDPKKRYSQKAERYRQQNTDCKLGQNESQFNLLAYLLLGSVKLVRLYVW